MGRRRNRFAWMGVMVENNKDLSHQHLQQPLP
jgi:hypothetical protein